MNFNYYNQGYQDGLSDALAGKKKNYTKFPKGIKSLISQAVVETYCQGYDIGYRDGLAKKNGIYR